MLKNRREEMPAVEKKSANSSKKRNLDFQASDINASGEQAIKEIHK